MWFLYILQKNIAGQYNFEDDTSSALLQNYNMYAFWKML